MSRPKRTPAVALMLTLAATLALPLLAQDAPKDQNADKPRNAGPTDRGVLLPNGWTLTPAGEHVPLNDLVLNIAPAPDGKRALVTSNGYNPHELSLVDLDAKKVVARGSARQSWFGLAVDFASGRAWWAGGGAKMIHNFELKGDELARTGDPEPEPEPQPKAKGEPKTKAQAQTKSQAAIPAGRGGGKFRAGLALDPGRKLLYSLDIDAGAIEAIDPESGKVVKSGTLGGRPYDVAVARNGARLYVSDWAGRAVLAVDPADLAVKARVAVGEHPNQIALHPKDDRLFVACASSNVVSVIDARRGIVVETIATTLFPRAPEGSTPDALAVAPDGKTLYVANADNNCVAVVDIEEPGRSAVRGFIPTGWYPTALAVTPDGSRLLVGVGKGNQTKPNPPGAEYRKRVEGAPKKEKGELDKESKTELLRFPHIGTTLSGALSIVPVPDEKQLAAYTEAVYRNCPYSDKLLSVAPYDRKTAIPTKVGDPSPIKHVIYIIKENRTYDQVFGDVGRGNGDPSLVMFGAEVTPNHHKLAEEFVLLDNLYCNGQVSRDGHPWSTMAYGTDYIARDWMLTYSKREGVDDDDEGNLSRAPSGYLWDACARAGLTYRSYGEFGKRVSEPDGSYRMEGAVPGLVGHICSDWGAPNADKSPVRDTDRVETFLKEFRQYEKDGNLPRFIVMSLGEDHTTGTRPGTFTPRACVASNDLALGRLVEAVSQSKFWPETAIFVIEDDAQNGPDHVDAHRTVGLVVSPYTRRGHLDSTQYQTVSMIRTIELILGLAPLSQYDAAARPMFESFTDRADAMPYAHAEPRIDLEARNDALAYGAERSSRMDFSEYDRIDDFELNEILWRALKGADAPLPPAVRRAIAYRPTPNGR